MLIMTLERAQKKNKKKQKKTKRNDSEILKIDVFRAIFRFSYIFFVFAVLPGYRSQFFLPGILIFGMRVP